MKIRIMLLSLMGFMLLSSSLWAQEKELKKAERLFSNYKYNAAIPYFEYYLEKEQRKKIVSTKTKLAYCYRMANKTSKAELLYADLVQEDRVRPIIYLYYGEMLMANGKYPDAKDWFLKYEELKPDDEKVGALIEACENVNKITSAFDITLVEPLDLNSEADEFSPVFYNNGIAFLSDQGQKGRTYGWTGRSFLKLYKSEPSSNGKFKEFKEFSKRINIYEKNTGPVSIARDGRSMIVTRNSDVPSKSKNRYNLQLFEVVSRNGSWSRGKVMEFCKPDRNYMHPALTSSGDTLYFVSDKAGTVGGTDIFMTYRTPKGWKRPINLGEVVNTTGHEAFPFVHVDGTLFFASKGHSGFGGFDLFKAEKDRYGEFTKVINLGSPINGARDDTGFILADDKKSGFFASSRMAGNDDIYYFETMDIAMKGEELAMSSAAPTSLNRSKSVDISTKITLKGTIVDNASGESLIDVKVYLEDTEGNLLRELLVDEDGQVIGLLNRNKEYMLTFKKNGYRTKSIFLDTNDKEGQRKINPTFKIEKR